MDWDEPQKSSGDKIVVGEVLDRFSVSDLETRIAALEAEIERVRAVLDAKREHEARAASIFKS